MQSLVDSLLPRASNLRPNILLAGTAEAATPSLVVSLNPQFIHLIRFHGGGEAGGLESAVHELEDPDAGPTDRLTARQRLKSFLGKIETAVESTAISALQKYLESKMSL